MSQAASAHRLIRTKRNKAAIPQLGVSDRPTFLSHTVRAEAAAGADEVIVLVALPNVLRRCFAPFRMVVYGDGGCLNGGGCQSQ